MNIGTNCGMNIIHPFYRGDIMSKMRITRHIDVDLSLSEQLEIFRMFVITQPEAAKIAFNNPRGGCPFPSECNRFPCQSLNCNSDVCDNGYAYRMS